MSGAMGGSTPNLPWSLAAARTFDAISLGGPGDGHINMPSASWPFLPGDLDPNFSVVRAQASGAFSTSVMQDDATLRAYGPDLPRYDGAGAALMLEPSTTE